MDLVTFRRIVDLAPPAIRDHWNDPEKACAYLGSDFSGTFPRHDANRILYTKIQAAFTAGHAEVWRTCRLLRTDLIRDHVLNGASLDPYFAVLAAISDAVRTEGDPRATITGDWHAAIRSAMDSAEISPLPNDRREHLHAREFSVAAAAKFLRDLGFTVRQEHGWLGLDELSERRVIAKIEDLVCDIGGLNVARRIFKAITPHYDSRQQRYHLTASVSMLGGGSPQVPWGYLVQLAVKHLTVHPRSKDSDLRWEQLVVLSRALAAVFDVQPYTPAAFGSMDAIALIPHLRMNAQYDYLFRLQQMRAQDLIKIVRGALDWMDFDAATTPSGWTLNQVLEVSACFLESGRDVRGPVVFKTSDIRKQCSAIRPDLLNRILDNVLVHPSLGANQAFSHPFDGAQANSEAQRADFGTRPLLRLSADRLVLIDCSVCGPSFLEAILAALRPFDKRLDYKIGPAIERFLNAQFNLNGINAVKGDYDVLRAHGECDLVVKTDSTIIFVETKKKALTSTSRVGNDASLMIDLASSLLAAQVQAGWHEVDIREHGKLELTTSGVTHTLNLDDRDIERVAVTLLDYGSFQDRIFLKQFLEAAMNANFTSNVEGQAQKFEVLNENLSEVRAQMETLATNDDIKGNPFYNCWFLSIPQILLLLDDVKSAEDFKTALWRTRAITTGRSDFYADLSYMTMLERNRAAGPIARG